MARITRQILRLLAFVTVLPFPNAFSLYAQTNEEPVSQVGIPRTDTAVPAHVDFSKFRALEGESTEQLIARLNYREVSAERDGFECGAGLDGGLVFSPSDPYPDGIVREFGIILPGKHIVKLELLENTYRDGRIVTKNFGTAIMRTNYGLTLGDLSRSYLLADEQIAAVQAAYMSSPKARGD